MAPDADTMSFLLDTTRPLDVNSGCGVALCGGGGFTPGQGATLSGQPRALGGVGDYWTISLPAADPMADRLPEGYGHEHCTIHASEMSAMLAALLWRRRGHWNLLVGDRAALLLFLERAAVGVRVPDSGATVSLSTHVYTFYSVTWRTHLSV